MIPVEPAKEPPAFHEVVRVPGERALAEMVGKPPKYPRRGGNPFAQRTKRITHPDGGSIQEPITREEDLPSSELPDYWKEALDDLMKAYDRVCAYSCFRIHEVTGARSVDHMAPKSRHWQKVYEWSNYRLCCSKMNARKRDFSDVLDPFEVGADWFELELVGFQVRPASGLDAAIRNHIVTTIERLDLNDASFRQCRERDAEFYQSGEISLRVLLEESPFVARELRRQGRLRPEDRPPA